MTHQWVSKYNNNELISHLEEKTCVKVGDICKYVKEKYGVSYSIAGMTNWLHAHKFSYKKPKESPLKADQEKQKAFVKYYEELKIRRPENEPILFLDSVRPTIATKVSYGWIRTGKDKIIGTIASRTRINLAGALDLETMGVQVAEYETINGDNIVSFLSKVKAAYSRASIIHIILDQAGYHKSETVTKFASENGIKLHYLLPYSPNLNPIERLWKVMNETIRNNVAFTSAKQFRRRIHDFFNVDYPVMAHSLIDRLTDNFELSKKANSF